jgi:hypothetical protein
MLYHLWTSGSYGVYLRSVHDHRYNFRAIPSFLFRFRSLFHQRFSFLLFSSSFLLIPLSSPILGHRLLLNHCFPVLLLAWVSASVLISVLFPVSLDSYGWYFVGFLFYCLLILLQIHNLISSFSLIPDLCFISLHSTSYIYLHVLIFCNITVINKVSLWFASDLSGRPGSGLNA